MHFFTHVRTRHWLYVALHAVIFLLGLVWIRSADVFWQGVGASLVAAGIAGWVVFLYTFVSEEAKERHALIATSGIRAVFTHRGVPIREEYARRLARASDQIDLIGFGLRSLREDFGDQFEAWSQRSPVRVLLIAPGSGIGFNLADQRDLEERSPVGTIRSEVRAFLRHVSQLAQAPSGRFKVRLYTSIPAINYFRIDDELFWGPYFVGGPSRNAPTFLVRRDGTLWPALISHFDNIWTNRHLSSDVPWPDFDHDLPR